MIKKTGEEVKKKHRVLKIILIIILAIILVAAVTGAVFYYKYIRVPSGWGGSGGGGGGPSAPPVNITYENFAAIVSQNSIIKALPSKGDILLIFYNLVGDVKVTEKSYILTKGEATEGYREDVDLTVRIHSKYMAQLNTNNFCSILQTANDNWDLDIERHISKTSFAWKYRNLYEYRDCLGF